jgi:hypothetical protein
LFCFVFGLWQWWGGGFMSVCNWWFIFTSMILNFRVETFGQIRVNFSSGNRILRLVCCACSVQSRRCGKVNIKNRTTFLCSTIFKLLIQVKGNSKVLQFFVSS